ncbi:DUF645 family protein [Vibrio cholerae]|uniref:DUF645 family protein n=1 Tax=Vibrio metoecus TaxID=1481663 RepID=UPI000BA90964|nr:DUF645 family protein [Vibrio metoecus]PAR26697.1 DUF645 domain-containing protein [Vibrio metoecus]PAR53850.1 DUF645 domain-containing protein [Vibrio metoecus]
MLSDVQHGQLSFTKGFITAEIMLSLSRTLNRGQPNHDRFEFWLPTSQLLALDVCLLDAFA